MKEWLLGGVVVALLAAGCDSSGPAAQTKADTMPVPAGGLNSQGGKNGGAKPPPPPPPLPK